MSTNLNITKVMTPQPTSLKEYDPLVKAKEIFSKKSFHHIPIVNDENQLKGVLSFSDYSIALDSLTPFNNIRIEEENERSLKALIIKDYMTSNVAFLREHHTVRHAIDIFKENKFHCLPVLDDENKLLGIVTTYDLLIELSKETFIW